MQMLVLTLFPVSSLSMTTRYDEISQGLVIMTLKLLLTIGRYYAE